MKNLPLNDRNSEFSEFIPKKIRSIVLNNILAKSLENGTLMKELRLFLTDEDLSDISEILNVKITISKKESKKYKPSSKIEKVEEENFGMIGFDFD